MLGLPYTIQEIAEACFAKDLFQGQIDPTPVRHISFDTRTISHGAETVFVAIKTGNRDGHRYIRQAYDQGVRQFVVESPVDLPEVNFALVEDSLEALQLWAMNHRTRFEYPVVAITGSNGKTVVKEWLATLMEMEFQIVKSPMSYNSQLGVAVSLLQMHPQADLAIIEAGISQMGEMERLETMIRPDVGIFTHLGAAHAEGFQDESAKLTEKLQLFQKAHQVLSGSWQPQLVEAQRQFPQNWVTTGELKEDALQLLSKSGEISAVRFGEEVLEVKLPFTQEVDVHNCQLAMLAAWQLGMTPQAVVEQLSALYPVEMRLELISDNPDITILNDSYNADPDSVRNAFRMLAEIQAQPRKFIILTDIPHLGDQQKVIQASLLEEAIELVGKENIWTVGPVFGEITSNHHVPDTDTLIQTISEEQFLGGTVLLKGARSFELERVIPLLNRKLNATQFQIDLHALRQNYRYLKSFLTPEMKVMCMVKAFSYGSGSWEIAHELVREGADYLAVAYASEGIELRKNQISVPIMVMNPDESSIEALIQFDIEPEISQLAFLRKYVRAARLADLQSYPIHLKLETGMGRLGFSEADLPELVEFISQQPDLKIVSAMSHLAAADDPDSDEYSFEQISRFHRMADFLQQSLGIMPIRNLYNTAGILRFGMDRLGMARMGIGLYGIDPVLGLHPNPPEGSWELTEIGSLRSLISQVQDHPAGVTIGYGRSQTTERPSRIATIPIGYADGIPRSLSNGKGEVLIHGRRAPIFGRVCMDMLMVDVTDIPEAVAGDEVVIFGKQGNERQSISELAAASDTIPYELLVRISPRVRRVYLQGGG
ncbi:bifunctional UDP-N-acetylmuramoyl-tripeptide:D-alanyl-D-alanine ligase/alanine racemase [Pontibacter sp. G13]|uniref:bifunctional UDP-N-acetylmuramoyl-tripeptide:D-alanyl-D-alanine ligase/alanine racemase n=1 Tax=Pontibacter sp. G13 TaxID=3074898 RepID=UPI00288931BD|nr:bifunctional UDP-N-acetylmuramoyl-tripeptide:D-alanyl-D-alanine ligase/alanine racemase [Pontibacter sp. G13]WNJ21240.1 bifunctional UDP-N-acetylmuramoyl-tripeptide:D-alanyl-D-alanine ligase/alanine racemase [Pontibacter sp. G13]